MALASRRRNAHGSESELRRLCYQWHRWYGRDVVTQKSTGVYAPSTYACRLADEKDAVLLQIPRWMFDAAACEAMGIGPAPRVDYTTLRALQTFLLDLGAPVTPPVVKPRLSQSDHGDGDGNKLQQRPVRAAADSVLRKSHTTAPVARSQRGKTRRDRAASGAASARSARSRKGPSKRRGL
jgi:hypothetical protein